MAEHFPTAELKPLPWGRSLFLVSIIVAVIACALLLWLRGEGGVAVTIAFREAHGLEVHDPVRFRGLDVGAVRSIRLADERDHVEVVIALQHDYADLARAGTRFWIAHPRLDWEGIGGLDTLVGTRYIGCLPGEGEISGRFVGLEEEPLPLPPGALPLRFHAVDRDGLHRGGPIVYRGLVIGRLVSVGLSSDARWVEADGYVEGPYRHLVFDDSRFCPAGGLKLDAGITGIDIAIPPLAQLATGGIALINMPQPGGTAQPGASFKIGSRELLEEAGEQGAVVIGRPHEGMPAVVAAELTWTVPRSLWFDGSGKRSGLAVPYRTGMLLPADFLRPPGRVEGLALRIADTPVELPDPEQAHGGLLLLTGIEGLPLPATSWRSPEGPEDLLLRLDDERILPLAGSALLVGDDGWHLDEGFPGHLVASGSPLLAASDGALIGILVSDPWRVLPLPPDL